MSEYATTDGPGDAPKNEPRRRAFALADGWFGMLLLMVVAAALGGLIAVYWPWTGDSGVSEERIAALEAQVSQLAAGHGGSAASGVFAEMKRDLAALSTRLAADEARLTALEKASAQMPTAAAPGPADALHPQLDQTASAIAALSLRLQKLEASGATPAQVADAVAKFTQLQARVTALDADVARTAATNKGALDATSLRIAKIEAALPPDLAARLDALAPKADLAASDTRIARLERMNSGDSLHRAAAVLALADLAQTADDGKPFTVELDALAAAQPGDPALAVLKPFAATGVPTLAALKTRFPVAARNALDAIRLTTTTDMFSQLWANLRGLISIRRVGDVEGNSPEARLARAQVRLDEGDLAGAANEIAAIGAPSAPALAPWLKDARARVALDKTVALMSARVVRAIAATRPENTGAPKELGGTQ